MNLISRSQLILLLGLVVFGCKKKPLPPLEPLCNSAQIFMHRVNDPNDAIHLFPNYEGIELDVFFDYSNQHFIVKHDKESLSKITLEKYFSVCKKFPNAKYWIDFKNLKDVHSYAPLARLNYLDEKFKIKNRIIIESKQAEKLHSIGREGYFTSYWIVKPHENETVELANKIKYDLTKFQFNALSGREEIAPFFQKYFGEYTLNYWTTDASNELRASEIFLSQNKGGILLVDDREIYKKVKLPMQ